MPLYTGSTLPSHEIAGTIRKKKKDEAISDLV